ncbi:hybrid sensor histidine kinase/response regulator [Clostridium diolis]|uniref:PAS domain S-box protein n=1 Tax=Clostridium diolis TaxID=223919 RepID=UPI000B3FF9F7|nr:PAS domain S-box protein [Clostridium diolis]OVE68967.1 hybrid sensor histidine kinase/response regulator [Clostridium diolis]
MVSSVLEGISYLNNINNIISIYEPLTDSNQVIYDFSVKFINESFRKEFDCENLPHNCVDEIKMYLREYLFSYLKRIDNNIYTLVIRDTVYEVSFSKFAEKYIFCTFIKSKGILSNEKLFIEGRDFIDNALESILVVSRSGEILYGNKKAIEMYGYSFDELVNLNIFTLRNEDSREFTQNQLNKALDRGIKFKSYHHKKDGTRFPVEVRSVCSNKKSRDVAVSIIRDISDMERLFKDSKIFSISLDILDDPFVIFDKEMNISRWSKGAETKFGFKEADIIGNDMRRLIPKDKLNESQKLIDMITKGNVIKDYETVRIDKEGNLVNVLMSASPIYDDNNLFFGVVAMYKDITDRKLIEKDLREKCEQLELLKQKAEEANKAKSFFLANISHEIRTPMNGITAAIQLLKLEDINEKQKKYIRILNDSANTVLRLINNLLDMSKIESGTFRINREPFNLKETINSIYNSLLVTGNSKGLEVSYYLDHNIDFEVIGDELRLKEILSNLISNAVKFTDDGYISFRVSMISEDSDSEKIQFTIKDSGIGIDDEFKDKIFNNFTQGNISSMKKYMGTGLGLSISKQFANLMNGEISFESSFGKGSTFIFTCEFKKTNDKKQVMERKNIESDKLNQHNNREDKVILYVEDNLISQEVMENIIRSNGYKYISAYNGNEAINILKNNKVDLILMDIQMPELNGFETTQAIRVEELEGKHIPIIAITAYAMREDKEKCIKAKMDDYISKPFEIENLLNIIEFNLRT